MKTQQELRDLANESIRIWVRELLSNRGLDVELEPEFLKKYPPRDDFKEYRQLYEEPIFADLDRRKKKLKYKQLKERLATQEVKKRSYGEQLYLLSQMSFIQAIILLQQFRYWYRVTRGIFNLNPVELRKQLGLTKKELGEATSSRVLIWNKKSNRSLSRQKRKSTRISHLNKQKQTFEETLRFRDKSGIWHLVMPKLRWFINRTGKDKFFIPNSQKPHLLNFLLYGIDTGSIVSNVVAEGHKSRIWQQKLNIGTKEYGYVPFLRAWFFYYYRHVLGFDRRKANHQLEQRGFPTVIKEKAWQLKRKYETSFLLED